MKTAERLEARRLRREDGLSIKTIARMLGVARSSVSVWVRDIELSDAQRTALLAANPAYNRQLRGANRNAERGRSRREAAQLSGRHEARRGDLLHAMGTMLYWAEGDKGRHSARLSNSDPELVRLFVDFLRHTFGLDGERIRVACNLFADHAERRGEIERFWLRTLGLPPESLARSTVNVYSRHSARKRRNMLPYGTCRVAVHDTAVVQHLYGAIQEYGGFERPAWLG